MVLYISSALVASVLKQFHPGVLIAAVIRAPDEEWGERVKAVVVPKEGAQITEDKIAEF